MSTLHIGLGVDRMLSGSDALKPDATNVKMFEVEPIYK